MSQKSSPKAAALEPAPDGAPAGVHADVSGLSFEQAMAELEKITKSLEGGKLPLAQALEAYQRGALLARQCQEILNEVQHKIDVIESGQVKTVDRSSLIAQTKE